MKKWMLISILAVVIFFAGIWVGRVSVFGFSRGIWGYGMYGMGNAAGTNVTSQSLVTTDSINRSMSESLRAARIDKA